MEVKHIRKVLALALALALASPLLNAQSDGFLGSYSEGVRDGGSGSGLNSQGFGSGGDAFGLGIQGFGSGDDNYGLNSQNFGNGDDNYGINIENFGEAPLGGGMAILVASAAGYALLKRRKSSKPQTPNNLKDLNHLNS